jgi:CHAT domain-containing protein
MWLALLLLALAGCAHRPAPSAGALYEDASRLLIHERFADALAQAAAALRAAPLESDIYWKSRLLGVEILLKQQESGQAKAKLNFQLPSRLQRSEEQVRYLLCRASIDHDPRPLDDAGSLAVSIGAMKLAGVVEFRKATLTAQQGDYRAAERIFHGVLNDAGHRKDDYLEMQAAATLAKVMQAEGRNEECITWSGKVLDMTQALDAPNSRGRIQLQRGSCYYSLGDLDKALRDFADAEAGLTITGDRGDAQRSLGSIANILYSRHDYSHAIATYKQALSLAESQHDDEARANWLNNLANISIETSDIDAGERYNNEAWKIWKDSNDEAYSVVNAGRIAEAHGDFPRAAELFRSALERWPKETVPALYAHAGLAQTLAHEGHDREAEDQFRATGALVEHQRTDVLDDQLKLSYFASVIEFYQDYVDFLMSRQRPREALVVAESSRARALTDKMASAHAVRGPHTAADLQRLAAALHATLLSYWMGPAKSYVWVVTRDGITAPPALPPESEIGKLVDTYNRLIQDERDPLEAENPAGRLLYYALIAPAQIPKGSRVIVVPDGPLYGLNLETLPVSGPTPHYWIEDAVLMITPSLNLLSAGGSAPVAPQSALLIGNPTPVRPYPPLENADREMTNIARNLDGLRPVVLRGEQASADGYLRSSPGRFTYIHFSTHAEANASEPLESFVVVTPRGDDFKLRARDVLSRPLQASLVTVSACESAGTRIYAGEGLVGFAWAFLGAGARSVVAGLWKVDDRASADLMSQLYAEISRKAPPADALRTAKLQLIHRTGAWHKPYYWGAFELFTRQP